MLLAAVPEKTAKSCVDDPGVEPGTAPMLRENHTDRPDALCVRIEVKFQASNNMNFEVVDAKVSKSDKSS
jgi:hypothetical protein